MFKPARMMKGYALFHRDSLGNVLYSLQNLGQVEFFDIKETVPELEPLDDERYSIMELRERVNKLLAETHPDARMSLAERVFGPSTIPVSLVKSTESPLEAIRLEIEEFDKRWSPMLKLRDEGRKCLAVLDEGLKEEEKRLFRNALLDQDEGSYEDFGELVREHDRVQADLLDIETNIRHFSRYARPLLMGLGERIENLLEQEKVRAKLGATRTSVMLGFWVPEKKVEKVRRIIDRSTDGACSMEFRKVGRLDDPPVLLENPWFIRPYEVLTTNYGHPRYRDLDPTPFLAITFTMLFGMMFADVGYGLALVLLSSAIYLRTNREDRLTRDLNVILAFGGSASMIFGFIFGEFLGGLVKLDPLWRNPMENIGILLYLSLFLGALHITISLISRAVGEMAYDNPPLYPLSLLIIMWGLVWFIIIGGTLVPLLTASMAYGIICLIKAKGTETFDELLALVINVASYARIGALFILHVTVARVLASVFLSLSLTPLGLVIGILVFTAATGVIIVSSAFIVFIHSLRLHWIEFFRRFYSGLGRGFEPFASRRQFTIGPRRSMD